MTRAAVYARRSTDEHQEASLDVQQEEALRYAQSKGWSVDPAHIYLEDAVSRAEFKKRPALIAMMNAAEAGAFDAVIARDETRLGGDTFRTGILIQNLIDCGVRLFYHYTDEEVRLDGATEKFMVAVRNFAAELEREKISQRTHEHLLNKARKGLVAGGLVFGYDNVRRPEGGTVRAINEEQAALVRELFERYAEGDGLRALAKRLNSRGVPPPRAGKRGTGSWSSSAIRAMLRRQLYRGELVWNRFQKVYRNGTKTRIERPPSEWIHVDVPELRIISPELWERVQERHRRNAKVSGVRKGPRPKYLLTGLARCAECGGPMGATNRRHGTSTIKVYVCKWHRERGDSVCKNTLGRPMEGMNGAVLDWVKQHILTEEVVVAVIEQVRAQLVRRVDQAPDEAEALRDRIDTLRGEMRNLTAALATGVQSSTVIRAIADREKEVSRLEAELELKQAAPKAIELELHRMKREARRRLADMKTIVARNPNEARSVLEALLAGPILCDADKGAGLYRMRAPLAVPEALGVAVRLKTSPAGFEPASPA